MNLSTLFRLGENLNLDRKTLIFLRWIAIFGQLTSVNLVYFLPQTRFQCSTSSFDNIFWTSD